jgi:hypothetical protein
MIQKSEKLFHYLQKRIAHRLFRIKIIQQTELTTESRLISSSSL